MNEKRQWESLRCDLDVVRATERAQAWAEYLRLRAELAAVSPGHQLLTRMLPEVREFVVMHGDHVSVERAVRPVRVWNPAHSIRARMALKLNCPWNEISVKPV